jgi:hypothetical protein
MQHFFTAANNCQLTTSMAENTLHLPAKTCTSADRGRKLSLPRTNPAQLYFTPKVQLTHVTTSVKHADYLPAWA